MMATASVFEAAQWIGTRLVAGSLQGGIVVGLVWLVSSHIESIPSAARARLWWLASLTLLLALTPIPQVTLPVLPPTQAAVVDAPTPSAVVPAIGTTSAGDIRSGVSGWLPPSAKSRQSWMTGVVALWLLCIGLQAVWLVAAHYRLRAVVARSRKAGAEDVALTLRLARDIGLPGAPDVRVSEEIEGPQVVGFWRPVILLPAAVAVTTAELTMTLYHELAHIRRHDLAFGWIPALAERLFFFHPLARLAAREYVVAREAACDAAVLRGLGVEPWAYAQLLVRFGIKGSVPSLSAAGSSTSSSFLRRRLDMLERVSLTGVGTRAVWCAVAAMIALSLPLRLVARTQQPVTQPPAAVRPIDATNDAARQAAAARTIVKQTEVRASQDAARQRAARVVRVVREEQRVEAEAARQEDRKSAERGFEPTSQFFLRALQESNQRLAELEAEREKRLSQLQDELTKRQAEREAARVESLLDTMKRAAETSPRFQNPNTAVLDAIEAQARRQAEQARQRPENPALAERLRREMDSLRAQVVKLEEQRETLLGQQRALVAAQERLSAEVTRLSDLIRQLAADRAR